MTTSNTELREALHGMWGSVAGAWEENASYIDGREGGMTERMVELCSLQPGERVLELACGPGSVGLAAADRVGAQGEVVISDVAPDMTAIAARRAEERGLTNVRTRTLDLEAIDEPDGAYDVVLCRAGLMLVPEPALAAREIARVLRDGGRAALAVWGPRERNPWLGLVFDAVSAQLGAPVPPEGIPGPFSLSDADALAALLAEGGLADVAVEELPVPMHAESFDEWWTRSTALAGPLVRMLAALPEEARDAMRARAREAAAGYTTPDGLSLPGVALLAGAAA
jgi:ubiquinone/menaquinone biosynthesis C-methylase UbiE